MGNYCESQELQFFFSINIILITLGVEAVSEVFLLLVIKFFIKNFSFTTNFIMIQILFQQWSLFFLHRFTAWPLDVSLLLLRPGKVWTIMKWLIPLLKHFSSKLVLNLKKNSGFFWFSDVPDCRSVGASWSSCLEDLGDKTGIILLWWFQGPELDLGYHYQVIH